MQQGAKRAASAAWLPAVIVAQDEPSQNPTVASGAHRREVIVYARRRAERIVSGLEGTRRWNAPH